MYKAVLLQLAATLMAAAASCVFIGSRGFCSAILGGMAYVLPSVFFAWRLEFASRRGERDKVVAFMAGELVKLALSVGLLMLSVASYRDIHWGAFLFGLVLAVKANLFAFFVKART